MPRVARRIAFGDGAVSSDGNKRAVMGEDLAAGVASVEWVVDAGRQP